MGHTNSITRLVATRDGNLLVSASLDRTVRLWNPSASATGSAEVVLDADSRKALAKRSGKKEVLEAPGVTVETVAAEHVFEGHRDWVQALGMSADEKWLISGDAGAQTIVWNLAERKEHARWNGYKWNWIVAAALSPDGATALVSEYRYKRDDFDIPAAAVRLYDATGQEKLDILKTQFPKLKPDDTSYGAGQVWLGFVAHGLIAADFSPDGKLLALGQGGETDTGKIHLIDTQTGKLVRTIGKHQYGVTDVKFTSDGQHVLSTGRDTTLCVSKVEDGQEVARLGTPRGGQFKDWLSALAVSPDEKFLAASDIAGLIHVWRLD